MSDKPAEPQKDSQERQEIEQLLLTLDKFHPTIPDSVTEFYLKKVGFTNKDPRLTKLVSVAAQKFIADVAHDALQQCKMRMSKDKTKKDQRLVLTSQDLAASLRQYGIQSIRLESMGASQAVASSQPPPH
ncbi:hypothetical protein GUITHDRAFT_156266 [Guillardia theta CCMP2712]|uniref:Transcription initiation factor TFIID subunit 10 n=1 Tax=Guillardia theta (strain CCMP2712) TaxID=905079 RepID=L1I965_GUITC|nr:hypothetical protein GUITHDRAFT_156266 [Guillardia theta CCMP2712]EKX32652.1 hypothetical protein GUITHDRAFT_156266 [Guillardia theta CCMP2712]|eukprot:XP_005819632.1 hypothetical protein GUITHDRAFT_156266 [Guillardia theta CCMP2712]